MKLLNALPITAVPKNCVIKKYELTLSHVKEIFKNEPCESFIGHSDTANILTGMLNTPVKQNRESAIINYDETFIIAAYVGPRLPEGAIALPKGASIEFYSIEVCDE